MIMDANTRFPNTTTRCLAGWLAAVLAIACLVPHVLAAEGDPSEAPAAGDDLAVDQARLADRFERLEVVIGRLAELSASTDPAAQTAPRSHRPKPRGGCPSAV